MLIEVHNIQKSDIILFIKQNKLLQLYDLNAVLSYPKHDSFFGYVTTYFSVFFGVSDTFLACYDMSIQYHPNIDDR